MIDVLTNNPIGFDQCFNTNLFPSFHRKRQDFPFSGLYLSPSLSPSLSLDLRLPCDRRTDRRRSSVSERVLETKQVSEGNARTTRTCH